jgi:hypothetical protein
MEGDFNELRVLEVLVDDAGKVTALRVEAVWGTHRGMEEPLVWDRAVFTVGAIGPLANLDPGARLELRPSDPGNA